MVVTMATSFDFRVPDDQEAGVYSNLLAVWHSPHEFTFDFAVTLPTMQDAQGNIHVPSRVVARVKVPPTTVADILKALRDNLAIYERNYGWINRPGSGVDPNLFIPDDLRLLTDEPEVDENGEDNE